MRILKKIKTDGRSARAVMYDLGNVLLSATGMVSDPDAELKTVTDKQDNLVVYVNERE